MTFRYELGNGFSNRDSFSRWIYQTAFDNYYQVTGFQYYKGNFEGNSENTMKAWIEKTHGCKFVRPMTDRQGSVFDGMGDYLIFDSYEDYLLLRLKC